MKKEDINVTNESEFQSLSDQIDAQLVEHDANLRKLWALARTVQREPGINRAERQQLLNSIYAPLGMKDIKENIANDVTRFDIGVSFRSSISHIRHLKKRLTGYGYNIARGENPKMLDRAFARALEVPAPKTLAEGYMPADLPIYPNTIIKPMSGAAAKGVYYINDSLQFISFRTGESYETLEAALIEVQSSRVASKPVWISEEVILGENGHPANDMKIYMFYGKPAMILEIARGAGDQGQNLHCSYRPSGETFKFGPTRDVFDGSGIPIDVVAKAETISKNSPVPFLRVDFHAGHDECYLGEITAHPGGTYAGGLYDVVDKEFGDLFIDAEARLFIDMLNGKQFDCFFNTYDNARPTA